MSRKAAETLILRDGIGQAGTALNALRDPRFLPGLGPQSGRDENSADRTRGSRRTKGRCGLIIGLHLATAPQVRRSL
jgi:hypothetical protein